MNESNIVGANPKNGRSERDFYPTPPEVTQALLDFLQIPKQSFIWECACGAGDMAQVIEANRYQCIASDIAQGHDFLKMDISCDWIITNPPFNISEDFIRHAAELDRSFAFLLKAQYWHSKKRFQLFQDCRPTHILPLTWRPDFTGQKGSLLDMMWVVWDKRSLGQETIYQPILKPEVVMK